jgi:metalloendopeptidase OMA1, mitochondrial
VEAEGQMLYKMIMQDNRQAILPEWDPRTRMVERVMRKLIPSSGLENVNVGLSRSMLEVIVADIGGI